MKRILLGVAILCAPALVGADPPCQSSTPPDVVPAGSPVISDLPPLSLEAALQAVAASPDSDPLFAQLAAVATERLGRPVTPAEVRARLEDPRAVQELFSISVPGLAAAFARGQRVAELLGRTDNTPVFQLPERVPLRDAARHITVTHAQPSPVAGDLVRYSIPNDVTDDEIRNRTAVGEILDRLALNRSAAPGKRFVVDYRGRPYSNFDDFVGALADNGHAVTADLSNEVADFIHLMQRQPDGTLREIQTDVRLRTGKQTADSREIIVPATHSHFIFRIRGPHVNADVEFYQGVHGTHFYPSLVVRNETWAAVKITDTYEKNDAWQALHASGLYLDALVGLAEADELFAGGYGQSGVCNDSVAVIQALLGKAPTTYPLLIDRTRVLRHLESLARARPALRSRYAAMMQAVARVPTDKIDDPTALERLRQSIPYPAGPTPYPGFDDVRAATPVQ